MLGQRVGVTDHARAACCGCGFLRAHYADNLDLYAARGNGGFHVCGIVRPVLPHAAFFIVCEPFRGGNNRKASADNLGIIKLFYGFVYTPAEHRIAQLAYHFVLVGKAERAEHEIVYFVAVVDKKHGFVIAFGPAPAADGIVLRFEQLAVVDKLAPDIGAAAHSHA